MKLDLSSWKGRLNPEQARMLRVLGFLVRLIVLSLPLYLVIGLGINLWGLQVAVASQSAWLLQAMGYQVVHEATGITINQGFQFFIIPDCTAWKSMLFLFALVFAVPGIGIRKRLIGMVVGIPVIWAANLARIIGVVLVQGAWGIETAMFIHDWIFQMGLIGLVLVIWIAWMSWTRGDIKSVFSWHQK